MSGKMVKIVDRLHWCNPYTVSVGGIGEGSVWKCECGITWVWKYDYETHASHWCKEGRFSRRWREWKERRL